MRRLAVVVLIVLLSGFIVASAADLRIEGGTLQMFRYEVDISIPSTSTSTTVTDVPSTTVATSTTALGS